jgi:hypothetical protein
MFAYGETVTFQQAGSKANPYNPDEPVDDWDNPTTALVDQAGVEPLASTEPAQDGRQSVIVGYRLYFDHIVSVDRLWRCVVRGEAFPVAGRPAVWKSPLTGWEAGTVVQVGGTDG